MCGRYTLFTPAAELEDRFGASFVRDDSAGGDDAGGSDDAPGTGKAAGFEPSYNCAPGQDLPVITTEHPDVATRMEWGLTPSWADERFDLINARAESVREKRSFADAFERRRCLVPADGFYEWVEPDDGAAPTGSGKRPYRVAFEDDRPFAMAGLYERFQPSTPETTQTGLDAFGGGTEEPDEGEADVVETFTIVTTEPNELIADLHHRMAVILDPADEETWLHADPESAAELLRPYPATEMTAHPVSPRVNSPANDGPELIEPVDGGNGQIGSM